TSVRSRLRSFAISCAMGWKAARTAALRSLSSSTPSASTSISNSSIVSSTLSVATPTSAAFRTIGGRTQEHLRDFNWSWLSWPAPLRHPSDEGHELRTRDPQDASQFGNGLGMLIHPDVDERVDLISMDSQSRRLFPALITPRSVSGFESRHQTLGKILRLFVLESRGHCAQNLGACQHIANYRHAHP